MKLVDTRVVLWRKRRSEEHNPATLRSIKFTLRKGLGGANSKKCSISVQFNISFHQGSGAPPTRLEECKRLTACALLKLPVTQIWGQSKEVATDCSEVGSPACVWPGGSWHEQQRPEPEGKRQLCGTGPRRRAARTAQAAPRAPNPHPGLCDSPGSILLGAIPTS